MIGGDICDSSQRKARAGSGRFNGRFDDDRMCGVRTIGPIHIL